MSNEKQKHTGAMGLRHYLIISSYLSMLGLLLTALLHSLFLVGQSLLMSRDLERLSQQLSNIHNDLMTSS